MKLDVIKEIAQLHGIKTGKMKKPAIIQAIQTSESNEPCFETGNADCCGQETCLWRGDCC